MLLSPIPSDDGLPFYHQLIYQLGKEKAAGEMSVVYNLAGQFYVSTRAGKPYGLLKVPNALVRGVFDAMQEPGIELPAQDGQLEAHITVFRPEEIALIGGPDALLNDRGKSFTYTLGRLVTFEPAGWPGVAKCFALHIHSPALQMLRKSYGLTPLPNAGKYAFHCTVAILKRGVLGRGDKAKGTTAA